MSEPMTERGGVVCLMPNSRGWHIIKVDMMYMYILLVKEVRDLEGIFS